MSLRFTPSGRILPPPEIASVVEVERLRREAAKLAVSSVERVSESLKKGYEDGVRAGRDAGRREAIAELRHIVDGYRAYLDALKPRIEPLVLRAVEGILGELPPVDITRSVIKKVIAEAGDTHGFRFRVAPSDAPQFEALCRECDGPGKSDAGTAVLADPLVQPGEIVVESADGQYHVGYRQQIDQLRDALK